MGNKEENDNINNRPKSKKLKMSTSISTVVTKFLNEYASNTPNKLKIVDAYLGYIFFTGIIQFVYCCLVGTFPFNAFLAGFISTVASFVLAASYRIQINKQNTDLFKCISPERAFSDFIFAHVVLHLVVVNFIG